MGICQVHEQSDDQISNLESQIIKHCSLDFVVAVAGLNLVFL